MEDDGTKFTSILKFVAGLALATVIIFAFLTLYTVFDKDDENTPADYSTTSR